MILEYIQSYTCPAELLSDETMPGIRVYTFTTETSAEGFPVWEVPEDSSDTYEILFVLEGSIILGRKNLQPVRLSQKDILLLSDSRSVQSVKATSTLTGVLLSVKKEASHQLNSALCCLMKDFSSYFAVLKQLLLENSGCLSVKEAPINYSVFYGVQNMTSDQKGKYFLLKVFEIIYFIGTHNTDIADYISSLSRDDYIVKTITGMHEYIENHLDKKLTIDFMSRKFNMSPTSFKSAFKRIYGQSVHKWIQEQRFIRAGELLTCTPLNIVDIAHSVGYDSMSQFNSVFKKKYGMTPCQYRKLSNTGLI